MPTALSKAPITGSSVIGRRPQDKEKRDTKSSGCTRCHRRATSHQRATQRPPEAPVGTRMQDVENEWLNKNKDVSDMVSGEDMSAPPIKDSSAGGAESSFDLAGRICAGMQLGGATPFRLPVGRQGRQGPVVDTRRLHLTWRGTSRLNSGLFDFMNWRRHRSKKAKKTLTGAGGLVKLRAHTETTKTTYEN